MSFFEIILEAIEHVFRPVTEPQPAQTPSHIEVQTPSHTEVAPPWFTWAEAQLGFHEVGNNRGLSKYIELGHTGSEGDPWCAIFACAAFEAAGVHSTRSASSLSFSQSPMFAKLNEPSLGCVVVYRRSGGGHVGFYCGETSTHILTLGGNEDNAVRKEMITKSGALTLVGYYWPKAVTLPKPGKIAVNDDGTTKNASVT